MFVRIFTLIEHSFTSDTVEWNSMEQQMMLYIQFLLKKVLILDPLPETLFGGPFGEDSRGAHFHYF
jgi:hypothetical protein